jgi:Low-density lipoprotein receptor domain class A
MKKLVFVMVIVFGFMACDDDDSSLCKDAYKDLDSCGLLSEGEIDCSDFPGDPQGICEANCMISSSCEDLEQTMCTATPVATIVDCFDNCQETHGFECDNGEFVDLDDQCNQWDDCGDNSDEDGCPQFICDDDERIPLAAECNGHPQCTDGSDEEGCTMWACDDGLQEIVVSLHCDGFQQCTDLSDEVGCPNTFVCDDGRTIPGDYECDGMEDCLDDSDEHNACPEIAEIAEFECPTI